MFGKTILKIDNKNNIEVEDMFNLHKRYYYFLSKSCGIIYSEDSIQRIVMYAYQHVGEINFVLTDFCSKLIPLELSHESKITIPESFVDSLKIKDNVLLIGIGDRLELWDEKTFLKFEEKTKDSNKIKIGFGADIAKGEKNV
ncbi:MAG: hypothetical protein RR400_00225 [Clostridia bacterium]